MPHIVSQLQSHHALVLQAEPGAGKSTAVPLHLLQQNITQGKKIIMLEPRRVAVRSIAHFLAKQLGEKVGERVGYQIRQERNVSAKTQLEIVTEGVLTKRLQNDPELSDVGLIIFDEFHERSIHADLALLLARETQDAYRDDLKLLVMSATLDANSVAQYLNHCPVVCCPGRSFAVSIQYQDRANSALCDQVIRLVSAVLTSGPANSHPFEVPFGDILVFLPGQADIKRCLALSQSLPHEKVAYLPLYGGLALSEQSRVLSRQSSENRRVIFATNIAETSLTIEGITCVIDSGKEKTLQFDVKSGLSRLTNATISKASATQRAGRAGRVQAGHCIRLWSESEHASLNAFAPEEITISDLTDLVLELAAWGITQYQEAKWLTAPPVAHFDAAVTLNQQLGLLDPQGKITPKGKQAIQLGVTPRLASMLLRCQTSEETLLACMLAALISERDIFVHTASSAHQGPLNTDITERVALLYAHLQNTQQAHSPSYVHRNTFEQVRKTALTLAHKMGVRFSSDATNLSQPSSGILSLADIQTLCGPLLFFAFPDRLAKSRQSHSTNMPSHAQIKGFQNQAKNDSRYLLANGRGVTLNQDDRLIGEPWLMVCDCDGQNKDGMIFSCAPITFEQVLACVQGNTHDTTTYSLDAKKTQIQGKKSTYFQSLVLKEEILSEIPKQAFANCIQDILQQEGLAFLNWTPACESWLARANWLGQQLDDFPQISEHSLLLSLDQWLLPYLGNLASLKQLKQLPLYNLLISNLSWEAQQRLQREAPEQYVTPQGKSVDIRYDAHQGPTVSVILQQMFGQKSTPCIAENRVRLRFELLSPARRPIQTTSDLENFWHTSYLDIAKEMRGRYPKHNWEPPP